MPVIFACPYLERYCAARIAAISFISGSVPRSNLLLASLGNLWLREVLLIEALSKIADSITIFFVVLEISLSKPPIMPATDKAFFESAITKSSDTSFRFT